MISALFVTTNGVYSNLEGCDPWDQKRDARKPKKRLSEKERISTPILFRDLLIAIVKEVQL